MKKLIFLLFFNLIYINAQDSIIDEARDMIKCGTNRRFNGKGLIKVNDWLEDANKRPILQKSIVTKNGLFMLHFDVVGINAVPQKDNNSNGIPDYIDSAASIIEHVFDIECNQIGYKYQTSDSGWGGSDATDIYFVEIGNGESDKTGYGFTNLDLEIKGLGLNSMYTSHILLDNDYSPNDSTILNDGRKIQSFNTTGIDGLKISFAHEYHHVIQNIYGNFMDNSMLHEMSSTYMEWRVYPELKDYFNYVKSLYRDFSKYVFGMGDYLSGYRYMIYAMYLKEKYDDEILKRMWENSTKGYKGLKALKDAFKEGSFEESFCDFTSWCYFTGKRTGKGLSFKNAFEFPEINFTKKDFIFNQVSNYESALLPYEIMPLRIISPSNGFISPDTIDVMFFNNNIKNALLGAFVSDKINFNLADYKVGVDYNNLYNSRYYFKIENDTLFCGNEYYLKGLNTECAEFAFPNPINFKENNLFLPVECSIEQDKKVEVKIYDTENRILYASIKRVVLFGKTRGVIVDDLKEELSSGNYIFITTLDDKNVIGKFSVINK